MGRDEILKLYEESGQQPTIILETEARFTVDNVLKSLPIINNQNLDRLCLVTIDYHMDRAKGIYKMFSDAGLCKYDNVHHVSAYHEEGCADDDFLFQEFKGQRKYCTGCGEEH